MENGDGTRYLPQGSYSVCVCNAASHNDVCTELSEFSTKLSHFVVAGPYSHLPAIHRDCARWKAVADASFFRPFSRGIDQTGPSDKCLKAGKRAE